MGFLKINVKKIILLLNVKLYRLSADKFKQDLGDEIKR